jgi:hypothetical protein
MLHGPSPNNNPYAELLTVASVRTGLMEHILLCLNIRDRQFGCELAVNVEIETEHYLPNK